MTGEVVMKKGKGERDRSRRANLKYFFRLRLWGGRKGACWRSTVRGVQACVRARCEKVGRKLTRAGAQGRCGGWRR